MLTPIIALVGRANVGKSTLFNYLTRSRQAIVADYAGVTHDRCYSPGKRGGFDYILVDTAGLGLTRAPDPIQQQLAAQTQAAIDDADVILFLVDGEAGLSSDDEAIAKQLRHSKKPVILSINKIDNPANAAILGAEFQRLGFKYHACISAKGRAGVSELMAQAYDLLKDDFELSPSSAQDQADTPQADSDAATEEDQVIPKNTVPEVFKLTIAGRPNVGKSTLINRLLGEERMLVADKPGTTRDAIEAPFTYKGVGQKPQEYILVDTAGIRRKTKVDEGIERFSVIRSLQAITEAHAVVYLIDAREGISDQDVRLVHYALDAGKIVVIGLNKWDGLSEERKNEAIRLCELKFRDIDFVDKHEISALHGSGLKAIFTTLHTALKAASESCSTNQLTKLLLEAQEQQAPPIVKGRRIRLRFAHLGGLFPFRIIIHGKQTHALKDAYRRYLAGYFRKVLKLGCVPVQIIYKNDQNPYV